MTSIWEKQKSISLSLLFWGVISVLTGIILFNSGRNFWYGFGIQAIAWGAIDSVIALFGLFGMLRKRSKLTSPEQLSQETLKLRRILHINTALDVFYIICGFVMAFWMIQYTPAWAVIEKVIMDFANSLL